MKEEPPEITTLSIGGSRSISGLLLGLKTLQNVNYDEVLEELQAKEAKSNKEIEELKKEVKELKKQKEYAEFERFKMTAEKDFIEEKLKKEIKAIEHELDNCKLDKEDLYGEIHALEEDLKACENRAKKAEEKYEELKNEADKRNQKDKNIILETERKNDDLERIKRDMEKKIEEYERKFEELKNHVLLLEENVYKMILDDCGDEEETPVSGNVGLNMEQSGSGGWDRENIGITDNGNNSVDETGRIESEEEKVTEGNDLLQVTGGSSSTQSSNKRKRELQSSAVGNVGFTSAILILDSDDEEISKELGEKIRPKVPKIERASLPHVSEDEMETDIGTNEVEQVNLGLEHNASTINQRLEKAFLSPCNDVDKLNTPSSQGPTISRKGEDKIGELQKSLNYFSKLPIGMVGDTDAEDSSSSSESEEDMGISFDMEAFKAKRRMELKKLGI